jgi:hypothetical protein
MFKGKVVAFALMLVIATSVYAGDVDDCQSNAGISCTRMKVNICPFGDFEFLRDACAPAGAQYIWITAKDIGGNPIPGIPWTDYWLNSCGSPALFMCSSPIAADSLTGANGTTTFGGRIAGGGCTIPAGVLDGPGIYISIQGKVVKAKPCPPISGPLCLAVDIKSPDLTGPGGGADGVVNLSDLVPFGSSYNTQWGVPPPPGKAFNACCDLNDDQSCNLSDFAFFGTHYQHQCQ